MMTPGQTERVRDSWAAVEASGEPFPQAFYARLFALDPSVRSLFRSDMATQERKLADTMALIVDHLDRPQTLMPRLEVLGRQHAGYGVGEHHYALVERALLAAIEDCLGEALAPATRAAWSVAYRALAEAMMEAEIDAAFTPR